VRASALRTVNDARPDFRLLADRIAALPPRRVVASAVAAQLLIVLAIGLDVRHNGWVYYQGGDQLWYYTSSWFLAHGTVVQPLVGYLWPALLTPISLVAGTNLVSALPAIVLLDVLVLLPIAVLAFYGTARLIGGRLFAYWALVVWLVTPLIGIKFTDAGYHQRFTELTLPQAFGLTAMADFPTMVAVVVSIYFCARVLFLERSELIDAAAGGAAAGIAIGLKPSSALFLLGPLLAFACTRLFRAGAVFGLALAPAVATLAVWKWRGYGYLPLLHSASGRRLAAGPDVQALKVPHYLQLDWTHFNNQLDLLREHFWSGRLVEWLVIAGVIGLARRSPRAAALVGGWFGAFALVKGGYSSAGIEDSSLLRIMIPTIPAFVLMLAALPYLAPRSNRRPVTERDAPAPPSHRARVVLVAGMLAVSALIPFVAIAAAQPLSDAAPRAVIIQTPLIPANIDLHLRVRHDGPRVTLTWDAQHPAGGAIFYRVLRTPAATQQLTCDTSFPAEECRLAGEVDLGATTDPRFIDRGVPSGRWTYRVGVAANWLDDPQFGDIYELSRAVDVTIG
jgi:hypothetical protein